MLRPACLLPAARLAPPHGLLTPRSGTEVSLQYLGPATRRTDAYRDGTLTRWSGAASQGYPRPLGLWSFLDVTTHHGLIVRPNLPLIVLRQASKGSDSWHFAGGIRPARHSAPRLSPGLLPPLLFRCAERPTGLILQAWWARGAPTRLPASLAGQCHHPSSCLSDADWYQVPGVARMNATIACATSTPLSSCRKCPASRVMACGCPCAPGTSFCQTL